ncbi:MAG: terminase small subunit [Candidatus Saccharibacteria bacterium]|nr:terminase small subunit [Candidatus Saccharibacteria bacterium]
MPKTRAKNKVNIPSAKKQPAAPKKKQDKLTLRQERFCVLYASSKEFFCNGVQSYIEAYNVDLKSGRSYLAARVEASRLLTNPNIQRRIDEIFESRGLNDQFVDKQLEKLVTQDVDFKAKLGAIKEYNAIKSRIKKNIDITSGGKALPTPIFGGTSVSEVSKDV